MSHESHVIHINSESTHGQHGHRATTTHVEKNTDSGTGPHYGRGVVPDGLNACQWGSVGLRPRVVRRPPSPI